MSESQHSSSFFVYHNVLFLHLFARKINLLDSRVIPEARCCTGVLDLPAKGSLTSGLKSRHIGDLSCCGVAPILHNGRKFQARLARRIEGLLATLVRTSPIVLLLKRPCHALERT